MENTYNYLKTAFQNLKQKNKRHPSLVFIVLVLWCIPLPYACNSIALVLLTAYSLFTFRKDNLRFETNLLFPIGLFVLMCLSLLWTHNFDDSVRALSKGLPLVLIPLCFLLLPDLTKKQKQRLFQYYSYGMVVYTIFFLLKAIIRFAMTHNTDVFFYHELVTEDVNAIHVSVYVMTALFYFITKSSRSLSEIIAMILLTIFLILLSSKNILVVFGLLSCYYLWYFKTRPKGKLIKWGIVVFAILIIILSARIKERLWIEFESNATENSLNYEIGTNAEKVYNVSVKKAWTQERFEKNDYFPGTAFRVYQARIFTEMLHEDPILFTGYGLNATDFKIAQKGQEHNLYEGYEKKNFHNEYIQLFAELGILGLVLVVIMLFINIKNALKTKDFMHISFAVLMISLFLTESFLSRQRGIVFFTILYCLFNTGYANDAPKKT
jgi:O-antigen ligase